LTIAPLRGFFAYLLGAPAGAMAQLRQSGRQAEPAIPPASAFRGRCQMLQDHVPGYKQGDHPP
jgi:hypothetical protein